MRKKWIFIILGIILFLSIVIVTICYNKSNDTISKIALKQEKMEDNTSMRVITHELQGKNAWVTAIFENPVGIYELRYPNGEMVLDCKGKEKIAIDYLINKEDTYIFDIVSTEGAEVQKEIKYSEYKFEIPDPVITIWPNVTYIKKGRRVTITANIEGIDEGELEYIWEGRTAETSTYDVGTHEVRVKAVDKYGNESGWVSKTFTVIDAVLPKINSYLISGNNFNILGNGNLTTYENRGYTTVFAVNGASTEIKNGSGSLKNVSFNTNLKIVEDGNYVQIEYIVTNNSTENRTISIATHADIQINANDEARIDNISGDVGFIMTDGNYYYNVILKGQQGITDVDAYWFGYFRDRFNNLWSNAHPQRLVNTDSGMTYSWQNRVLTPGETQSFIVRIGLE